jgi:antitoxin VapB
MALNIKNTQVERLAAEVARITGETKVEAIRRALQERKAMLKPAKRSSRIRDIQDYLEREVWPNIPANVLGKKLSKRQREEILGMHI